MGYKVNKHGIVTDPGKFEGLPGFVPFYWEEVMNGGADEELSGVALFRINEEDREGNPVLAAHAGVGDRLYLWEDEQGFVHYSIKKGDGLPPVVMKK